MPLSCADLPYDLEGGGYSFSYENPGDGGRLWIYNTGNVDFGGTIGQQIGESITVHVSAHADTGEFSTLHLTPDHGPWQRFHVRYVNGMRQRTQGRNECRERERLDQWWNEMADTLDACAAAFWNATEARAAMITTEAASAKPREVSPDDQPDINDVFDATYEMERSGRMVDTSAPDPDEISIADISPDAYDLVPQQPVLFTEDGQQVLGYYLDQYHVVFPGAFMFNGLFHGNGVILQTQPM